MKETLKTVLFLILAILIAGIGWYVNRSPQENFHVEEIVGKDLFPELNKALDVARMEIIRYDEERGEVVPFEIKLQDKGWVIPSHDNYPADATDQVVEAATSVMGLKVISVVSQDISTYESYGVVDPDPKKIKPGSQGVGMKVILSNAKGDALLDLIIGKEVDKGGGKRYVRRAGQEPVYTVALKTDKLSGDFSQWIRKDLLDLNPWDIRQIQLYDYTLDITETRRSPIIRGNVTMEYSDMNPESPWKLVSHQLPVEGGFLKAYPAPVGKVLNHVKLDQMRNALSDLQIINVAKKPQELSNSLKMSAGSVIPENILNEMELRGFYLIRIESENAESVTALLSNEGEIYVTTKEGVTYVLRFGNIAGRGKKQSQDKTLSLNRYLFIMAMLDTDVLEQPELKELPELPPEGDPNLEQVRAERAILSQQNRESQNNFEKAQKKAQEKVAALNERFQNWYYIISDEVYEQIRLKYEDVFISPEKLNLLNGETKPVHDHDSHTCTDKNCPHHHGEAAGVHEKSEKHEVPEKPEKLNLPNGETKPAHDHDSHTCTDKNCQHHHGEATAVHEKSENHEVPEKPEKTEKDGTHLENSNKSVSEENNSEKSPKVEILPQKDSSVEKPQAESPEVLPEDVPVFNPVSITPEMPELENTSEENETSEKKSFIEDTSKTSEISDNLWKDTGGMHVSEMVEKDNTIPESEVSESDKTEEKTDTEK